MKKVIVLCSFLVALIACDSGSSASTKVCSYDGGETGAKSTVTIEYKDKKATQIHYVEKTALAEQQFESKSEEELQKLFESHYIKPKQKQKGLTFVIKVSEKKKQLTVDIQMDLTQMSEGDLMEYNIDNELNLKKIVKAYEAKDYTCKDK